MSGWAVSSQTQVIAHVVHQPPPFFINALEDRQAKFNWPLFDFGLFANIIQSHTEYLFTDFFRPKKNQKYKIDSMLPITLPRPLPRVLFHYGQTDRRTDGQTDATCWVDTLGGQTAARVSSRSESKYRTTNDSWKRNEKKIKIFCILYPVCVEVTPGVQRTLGLLWRCISTGPGIKVDQTRR